MENFKLVAEFEPCGDQPQAIEGLLQGLKANMAHQTLLGVTGSGKTFTMANVIAAYNKPTLVLSHNKTLAAQLASEFKMFFPDNKVEYFISYYDYYQPEAYIPGRDLYIEKDASINQQIDRLRHSATHSVLTHNDVIVVASVSCIYGLGSPEDYENLSVCLEQGSTFPRDDLLKKLVSLCYERKALEFQRGMFRVRGDVVDVFPAYEETRALRVEFWGDEIEGLYYFDPVSGKKICDLKKEFVYPASHYAVPKDKLERAIGTIREELEQRLKEFASQNKVLEEHRLRTKTNYDMELMQELGTCPGIENYSRHFSFRKPGEKPFVLLDYFPKDFLLLIDESHASIPQTKAMYPGDFARKKNLVEYGFRLPSAFDNRPLKFEEFQKYCNPCIFVSATPADYEIEHSNQVVEQIIRPTGLMDPEPIIRPAKGQVDDVIEEVRRQIEKNQRTLVVVLTKKMAEDLSAHFKKLKIKSNYLHSNVETLERIKVLKELRQGKYDVIVGVNLLREGLDLPEVSLVTILDADKEGFLRNERSLIQTMGRAARNVEGRVILYADVMTKSVKRAVNETNRRRKLQGKYNKKHGITPQSIQKVIKDLVDTSEVMIDYKSPKKVKPMDQLEELIIHEELGYNIIALEDAMREAAEKLDFEKAALLRDRLKDLNERVE